MATDAVKIQRKATLSGLEARVLVRELSSLRGAYVSNIHSLGETQVFRLRDSSGGEVSLVLSPRFGAWVTERPAHTVTNEFTTALRGALLRWKVEDVTQYDLDRVFIFRFSSREKKLKLILELMPPGNIILVDDGDERVILALREAKGNQRSVLRGRRYAPPPQSRASPEAIDEATLEESFSREKTVGKALGRGLSLPRKYVDEILARASLNQEDPAAANRDRVGEIVRILRELVASLDNPSPSLVEMGGNLEIMAVRPTTGIVIESAPTMSKLADEVFFPHLVEEENEPPAGGEQQKTRELEVTLQKLEEQVVELREEAVMLRAVANQVRGASSAEESKAILVSASVDAKLMMKLEDETAPASISSKLFDEAKGNEAEARRIEEVEVGVKSRLAKVRKVPQAPAVKIMQRGKKDWYEKFRWFFTTEGRLAVGGRDAQSNSLLVKRHLQEGDVAYHADLFGSPFFILKSGAQQTSEEVRQVALATASFSSAWKTGLAAADAYWMEPDQVSATAPSGEYLAKGSFVIRGKKNFVTKNPVEVAVGMDARGRVVCGPEAAVMKQSRAHLTLIPSREKSSDTAKKVLFELKKLFGTALDGVNVDDVMRALPTGGGKVIRRRENWKEAENGGRGRELVSGGRREEEGGEDETVAGDDDDEEEGDVEEGGEEEEGRDQGSTETGSPGDAGGGEDLDKQTPEQPRAEGSVDGEAE